MKIAVITDVHAAEKSRDWRIDSVGELNNFSHLVQKVERLDADVVIILGDLILNIHPEKDRRALIQMLRKLEPLKSKVIFCLGNHESRSLGFSSVQDILKESGLNISLFGLKKQVDQNIIWLSTIQENIGTPRKDFLPQDQFMWLKETIPQVTFPTLVFLHHHLHPHNLEGNYYVETYGGDQYSYIQNWQEVMSCLTGNTLVKAVFVGHTHWFHYFGKEKIPIITLPSAGEKFFDAQQSSPNIYSLIDWLPDSLIIKAYSNEFAFAAAEINS